MALIAEAEKRCPHNSSVIAFTLRVDTPCTYISVNALTSAFSLRAIGAVRAAHDGTIADALRDADTAAAALAARMS